MKGIYNSNIFINCPFDENYKPIHDAIVFTIFDCGFIPRSASEEKDSGNVRLVKIMEIIAESKFGIHDISRTEIDKSTHLPRFNMPFELGLFLGAKKFGDKVQKRKNILILDKEKYRYQKFISDIAGQDIEEHNENSNEAILKTRNWLNNTVSRTIPGGNSIYSRYQTFQKNLPDLCKALNVKTNEVLYKDYCKFIKIWLKK